MGPLRQQIQEEKDHERELLCKKKRMQNSGLHLQQGVAFWGGGGCRPSIQEAATSMLVLPSAGSLERTRLGRL